MIKHFYRLIFAFSSLVVFSVTPSFANSIVKVAFTADQGTGQSAVDVLQLVRDEGADLLVLQGDFGYNELAAQRWEDQINLVLGKEYPVVGVVGNHENYEWPLYKKFLSDRLERNEQLKCSGDIGVKSKCQFANIEIVQVAAGIKKVPGVLPEDNYPDFITDSFEQSEKAWRICSWHKNQSKMQAGSKADATGWQVYQRCLEQGAIVVTGHEHHYSRTFLMDGLEQPSVIHRESEMLVEKGATIVVVSGLGGKPIREQVLFDNWWASVYSRTQNAVHGALFCSFAAKTANCYFKDVLGAVPDRFSLTSGHAMASSDKAEQIDSLEVELALAGEQHGEQGADEPKPNQTVSEQAGVLDGEQVEHTLPSPHSQPNEILPEAPFSDGNSGTDSSSVRSGSWDSMSLIVLLLLIFRYAGRMSSRLLICKTNCR